METGLAEKLISEKGFGALEQLLGRVQQLKSLLQVQDGALQDGAGQLYPVVGSESTRLMGGIRCRI